MFMVRNQSAENLYGWRDYEALGQNVASLLIDDENQPFFEKIVKCLNMGQHWSGKFPFKKRSGQMFMSLVTKSPLYENNDLVGIITVSSDNATLDDVKCRNETRTEQREQTPRFGRLRPQPDIASSVTTLV